MAPVRSWVGNEAAQLEEDHGVDGAAILSDRPPGGRGDVATNASVRRELIALESRVDLKLEAFEARMGARFATIDHRFDRFEHQLLAQLDRRLRAQSWVTISTVIAAMGMIVAAVRL
jgi:hypothetical protein